MLATRVLSLILLVAAMISLTLSAPAADQANFDPGPYLHAQRLVDIGGRRLNLYCTGTSSPTVVLDAGLGGTTSVWRNIQPAIARTTRVCSYDRAGMGFSDPAPGKVDAAAVVTDLHALLQRAAIDPPYILVGHSIAGLYERLYADRYPSDVAGMVLIDPVYPNEIQDLATASPVYAKSLASGNTDDAKCLAAAVNRELVPGSTIFNACGLLDARQLQKACDADGFAMCRIEQLQNEQQRAAPYWEALTSEYASWAGASSTEVESEQRNLGSLPLVVLTRGNTDFDTPNTPVSAQENFALWKQLHAAHERIAATSSNGTDIIVAHSGHDIQNERPAVVISAINEVIDQVRRAHK